MNHVSEFNSLYQRQFFTPLAEYSIELKRVIYYFPSLATTEHQLKYKSFMMNWKMGTKEHKKLFRLCKVFHFIFMKIEIGERIKITMKLSMRLNNFIIKEEENYFNRGISYNNKIRNYFFWNKIGIKFILKAHISFQLST